MPRLQDKVCIVTGATSGIGRRTAEVFAAEGATQQMMKDNGYGFNYKGLFDTALIDYHNGWKTRADELSETLKHLMPEHVEVLPLPPLHILQELLPEVADAHL